MKRPSSGAGTVYFMDGTHANVEADDTLWVKPADVGPLIPLGWTRVE